MADSLKDIEENETSDEIPSGKLTNEPSGSGTNYQVSSIQQNDTAQPNLEKNIAEHASVSLHDQNPGATSGNMLEKSTKSAGEELQNGMANLMKGLEYQKKLAFKNLCHAVKLSQDEADFHFDFTSEDPKFGKFDDLVIRCKDGNEAFNLFIQAKSISSDKASVRLEEIKSIKKSAFSISMYFNDFMMHNIDQQKTNMLVICTNIPRADDTKTLLKECSLDDRKSTFLKSLSDEVYQIDKNQLDDSSTTSLFNHILENSEPVRLANDLAKAFFKKGTITLTEPAFEPYLCAIIKMTCKESENSERYKFNWEFVDSKDEKTRHFYDAFEKACKKQSGVDDFKSILLSKTFSLKFPTKEKPEHKKFKLPENVTHLEIGKFVDSFRLVCNAKVEDSDLMNCASKLLPLPESRPAYRFIHAEFLNWLQNWINRGKGALFIKKEVQDFRNISVASLQYIELASLSKSYCKSLLKKGFQCKIDVMEQKTLYENIQNGLLRQEKANENDEKGIEPRQKYPSWFVLQIVQSVQKLSGNDFEILFIDDKIYDEEEEAVKNVFRLMDFPLVLVIDRSERSVGISTTEFSSKCPKTKRFTKVKILIEPSEVSEESDEQLLFQDLTNECNFKKRNVNAVFFGTSTPFNDIFYDTDPMDFVSDVDSFSKGSAVYQNKNQKQYSEKEQTYIPRRWKRLEKDDKRLANESTFMLWKNGNVFATMKEKLSGKYGTDDCITINELSKQIRALDTKSKWNFKTFGLPTNAGTANQRLFLPPGFAKSKSNSDKEAANMKVQIILNQAGTGKSFYMIWLANFLQKLEGHKDFWVIKINLPEHSKEFAVTKLDCPNNLQIDAIRLLLRMVFSNELVKQGSSRENDQLHETLEIILKMLEFSEGTLKIDESKFVCTPEQKVLLRIFKSKFNNKKLIILMDSFDETAPFLEDIVLDLIRTLQGLEGVFKLYLASRPYDLRHKMDKKLGNCGYYCLENFNTKEVVTYIERALSNGKRDFYQCAKSDILALFTYLLNMCLSNMVHNPLILWMGVELLLKIFQSNLVQQSTLKLKTLLDVLENEFSPLTMMESIIEEKQKIRMQKTGSDTEHSDTKNFISENCKKIEATHSCLALYALMPKNEVAELLSQTQKDDANKYLDELKNGTEKSGIVDGVVDAAPIFIHRLFTEFFAALWFFSNFMQPSAMNFLKYNVYQKKEMENVRQFLDRMICRENILHMAILEGLREKVEGILNTSPAIIQDTDRWGRTPAHIATLYGRMVGLLLETKGTFDVLIIKDTYFGWTAMSNTNNWIKIILSNFDVDSKIKNFLNGVTKIERDLLKVPPGEGRKCRLKFVKCFFEEIASDFISEHEEEINTPMNCCDGMPIILHMNSVEENDLTFLKACVNEDSQMFQTIAENLKTKEPIKTSAFLRRAFNHRAINVVHYIISQDGINFPPNLQVQVITYKYKFRLLWLVAEMYGDEMKFLHTFEKYCLDFSIHHRSNAEMALSGACLEQHSFCPGILLKRELSRFTIPETFELSPTLRIDRGCELLISLVLQTGSCATLEYLMMKLEIPFNNSFIQYFVKNKNIEFQKITLKFLISKSVDLETVDEQGRNLLHFAVANDQLDLVELLIVHGFNKTDVNSNEKGWDAIFYCVHEKPIESKLRLKIFKFLIELKKESPVFCFEHKDSEEKSVFYYAVKNCRSIAVEILRTRFSKASRYFDKADLTFFMDQFSFEDHDVKEILFCCPKRWMHNKEQSETVCEILNAKKLLQYKDSNGRNLLHISIYEKWFEFLKILIEHYKFDVTETNAETNAWNAFFYCVQPFEEKRIFSQETVSFFMYLLNKEPNYNCVSIHDSKGKSVFYYVYPTNYKMSDAITLKELNLPLNQITKKHIAKFIKLMDLAGFHLNEIVEDCEKRGLDLSNNVLCAQICQTLNVSEELQRHARNDIEIGALAFRITVGKYAYLARCVLRSCESELIEAISKMFGELTCHMVLEDLKKLAKQLPKDEEFENRKGGLEEVEMEQKAKIDVEQEDEFEDVDEEEQGDEEEEVEEDEKEILEEGIYN